MASSEDFFSTRVFGAGGDGFGRDGGVAVVVAAAAPVAVLVVTAVDGIASLSMDWMLLRMTLPSSPPPFQEA